MKTLKLNELVGHDVLEFCYNIRYPEHWNSDSIFVQDDEFFSLSPFIEQVILNYMYFGPQKISVAQWEQIKQLVLEKYEYQEFFQEIDNWICKDPEQNNSFWILGV